jgi:hypothetical protein
MASVRSSVSLVLSLAARLLARMFSPNNWSNLFSVGEFLRECQYLLITSKSCYVNTMCLIL